MVNFCYNSEIIVQRSYGFFKKVFKDITKILFFILETVKTACGLILLIYLYLHLLEMQIFYLYSSMPVNNIFGLTFFVIVLLSIFPVGIFITVFDFLTVINIYSLIMTSKSIVFQFTEQNK